MNISKNIAGWALLISGVVLIAWALISSYNIFTAKTEAPEIFTAQTGSLGTGNSQTIDAQLQKALQEQLKGLIPVDTLPKILNLAAWSMLAFVLIFGGAKISEIGIKLLNK
ncbi:MAG: hypothetical protein ABIG40_03005 [Parcubacteria group bacterium]